MKNRIFLLRGQVDWLVLSWRARHTRASRRYLLTRKGKVCMLFALPEAMYFIVCCVRFTWVQITSSTLHLDHLYF